LAETGFHPIAPEHVPSFIAGPDGSDPLFTVIAIFAVILVLCIGALYFTLHALPEKMAHGRHHTQMQIVGILAILALFTHQNIYWVLALLVAALHFPDFLTPIQSIADSLSRMRGQPALAETPPPPEAETAPEAGTGEV